MNPSVDDKRNIQEILQNLNGMAPLKELFWSRLSYDHVNRPLTRQGWPEAAENALADDPVLFASAGDDHAFHIIYGKLNSNKLLLSPQRPVITTMLREHPYALFIFSDKHLKHWHFVNVKYEDELERRKLFRRFTIGPGERLRTASEQIASLDVEDISASPLAIQKRHDDAFDVEKVQKDFFRKLDEIYKTCIAPDIKKGLKDEEKARQAGLILMNRLLFLYFIQKKGWLNQRADYLYTAFLEKYGKPVSSSRYNYYNHFLYPLFEALSIPGPDRGSHLSNFKKIPFLNGGLFEPQTTIADSDLKIKNATFKRLFNELLEHYNFTVTEDTPFDVEVAVDPEMLGKIFEELVTGRHETGAYYTPRPVVSFMCREALKGHLGKAGSIKKFVDEYDASQLRDPEGVLQKMRKVRICDPACGSGAYLVGMMQELMALRQCLFASHKVDPHTDYQRKLEIIQNSIYGVDIDPIAVNIARLRLWLSLAVEYEGEHPPPLPNLDFKIERQDSLSGPNPGAVHYDILTLPLIDKFTQLKKEYSRENIYGNKWKIRKKIDQIREEITNSIHSGEDLIGFDWTTEFPEVFSKNQGFDIIVANPPYVRQELIKDIKPLMKKRFPEVYTGTADLYCYFYNRAVELLSIGGMLVFISSNKWFRANYGKNLKKYISSNCEVNSITDFGELPVFTSGSTFPMIFVARKKDRKSGKKKQEIETIFTQVKTLDDPYPNVGAVIDKNGEILPPGAIDGERWLLTDAKTAELIKKMESVGVPLGEYVKGKIYYGIKTGFNKAFIIDGEKREELISEDARSAEIIKPLIVGDDVRKWRINRKDRWLIFTKHGIDINQYPSIKEHLKKWQNELEPKPVDWDNRKKWPGRKSGKYKWYEIHRMAASRKWWKKEMCPTQV